MEEDKLKKLIETLDSNHSWPSVYMFKFIIPSDNSKIARLEAIFNTEIAEIRSRESANGKYTSITVKELMLNAQGVLEYYRLAAQIEGLIAL
jgi:uncharacterized protein